MILNRLKAWLLDNFLIKIVSLVFAVILWFYVNSRGGAEMDVAVPLELKNVPARLVVVGDMIDEVTVRVKGRDRILQEIVSTPIHAVLDLTEAREGDHPYFLDSSAIAVPANLQIIRISPQRILVHLEQRLKKDVPVSVSVYGKPAPGFRIGLVEADPASVRVEGARSIVDPLSQLVTEPIDVTGAQKTFVHEAKLNLMGKEIQVEPVKPILIKIHIIGQN
jgi:YbbR domain-containing protein